MSQFFDLYLYFISAMWITTFTLYLANYFINHEAMHQNLTQMKFILFTFGYLITNIFAVGIALLMLSPLTLPINTSRLPDNILQAWFLLLLIYWVIKYYKLRKNLKFSK